MKLTSTFSRHKRLVTGFLALSLVFACLAFPACGGSQKDSRSGESAPVYAPASSSSYSQGVSRYASDSDMEEAAEWEVVIPADEGLGLMAPEAGGVYATNEAKAKESDPAASDTSAAAAVPADLSSLKLVYTGNLSVETLDYDQTLKDLRAAIDVFAGIIEYENESTGSTYWYRSGSEKGFQNRYANFTVRVPAASFYPFMDTVNGVGVVTSKDINVDNITRRYNDTSATVTALKKEEERLLAMMDQAESVEDMIAVEERLSEVERELNTYQTRLSGMDLDVAYSTVVLYIREVERIKETEPVSFLTRLQDTFFESLEDFSIFVQDLVVGLLYLLPFLLLLIVVIWIIAALIRHRRKRKAKKKAAREQAEKAAAGKDNANNS